jgi:hypothetical protein
MACSNNKPLSEDQKQKVTVETREFVANLFKVAEAANPDSALKFYDNSSEFAIPLNGKIYSYEDFTKMIRAVFGSLDNQKITPVVESYNVLDKNTVIYSFQCKCVENFKDGSVVLQDPWYSVMVLRKIKGEWRIVSGPEWGEARMIKPAKTASELDQLRLFGQFQGTWQANFRKDTTDIYEYTQFGKTLLETDYIVTKGVKTKMSVWNYAFSPETGKFKIFVLDTNGKCSTMLGSFESEHKWNQLVVTDFNPDKVSSRAEMVFDKPGQMSTTGFNAKGEKIDEVKVIKVK